MPEISLKEYFSKLNDLLSENAVDEVFLHCRHILQVFPKNVTAYRFLGRTLVMNGRWEEGREALRRVLSVVPDDYVAHLSLSQANERLGRADEAIWHLERAFEQRPNDKEIIDALRSLYSQHRNVHNLKIQLTSAAVARQYVRSGAYTQAVDTLRSALSRMNERLDLKLLLAQILWEHGEEEEAAELALEVLSVLPDCLEANKIMAQLWLGVNRPSDAQRYVNHLEAVDPYLAVEVAQGYPPEDDTFRLDELDYVSSSQSEIASGKLDWLQEISSMPTSAAEPEPVGVKDSWSDWASAMLSGKVPPEPTPEPGDSAAAFDDFGTTSERFAAMAPEPESTGTGFTELFGKPEAANADELSAMFAPAAPVGDDPMAWLHEAGVEIVESGDEEPGYNDFFGDDEDVAPTVTEVDPMAWLRDSTGDPIIDELDEQPVRVSPAYNPHEGETNAETYDDPFAWMLSDAGVALDDVLPGDTMSSETLGTSGDNSDSLDWFQNERILNESSQPTAGEPNLAWDALADVTDDNLESAVIDDIPETPSVPGPRRGLTAMLQEANLDWVAKKEEAPVTEDELDDWLTQFGSSEPAKPVTDSPDWLLELDQPQAGELASADASADEPDLSFAVGATEDEAIAPAWGAADDEAPQPDDGVDWMRDLTIQPEAVADNPFASMTSESEAGASAADDEEPSEDEMSDWLSELEPEQESDESEASAEAEASAATEEETDDFDWLSEAVGESAVESEEELQAAEIPGWLSELQPEPAESESEAASSAAELEPPDISDFPWMADATAQPEAAAEPTMETMPDWLAELAPQPETEAADVYAQASVSAEVPAEVTAEAIADEMDWLNEAAGEEAEAAVADMPDWLAELAPEAEAEPEAEPEPEQPAITEFPWMADEAVAEAPVEVDSEFTWMNETGEPEALAEASAAADEPEAEAEISVMPDWLAELEPQANELVAESETLSSDEDSWLTEAAEAPAEAAETIPSWLAELESQQDAVSETPAAEEDDYTWLEDEEEAAAPAEAIAADSNVEPGWLYEPEPSAVTESAYDDEEDLIAEMSSDNFDDDEEFDADEADYGFLDDDEILEPSPANNAPDWLNAMVPGLDVDYEPGEYELSDEEAEEVHGSPQREYAWVTELVEEEMAATERPAFAFSRPPAWIGSFASPADDGVDDDQLPDWPSDDADADVPEWLR